LQLPVNSLDNISICVLLYWVNGTDLSLSLRSEEPTWMALAGGPLCQLLERVYLEEGAIWRNIGAAVVLLPWAVSTISRWVGEGRPVSIYKA
jgi:hypothetical protein